MSLPKGYTELEYIESTGTQYIDTIVSAASGFRITCVVELTSINNSLNMLFGSHDTDSPYYRNFLAVTSGGQWEIGAYNHADFGAVNTNTKYDIDVCTISDAIGCTVNGVVQNVDASIAASTIRSSRTVYLFGLNYSDGLFPANMKLFGLKMYLDKEKTKLVRDFVPCKNSNGVCGLYDLVNSVFYANAGTGEFIAGPEAVTTPKAPANFRVESKADTMVTLAWDASDKAVGYRLYRSGQLLADTEETSVSVAVEPFAGAVFTVTAYNENGEGAGTSLTYFSVPENPILYLITGRTQADVDAGNEKGIYQASDLNRVGAAMNYVAERLTEFGYDPHISPKTDWEDTDWITVSDGERYLADLAKLRSQIAVFSTTPEVPPRLTATGPQAKDGLNYERANDIEKILEDIDLLLTYAAKAWFFSGDVFSGEV